MDIVFSTFEMGEEETSVMFLPEKYNFTHEIYFTKESPFKCNQAMTSEGLSRRSRDWVL